MDSQIMTTLHAGCDHPVYCFFAEDSQRLLTAEKGMVAAHILMLRRERRRRNELPETPTRAPADVVDCGP